MNKSYFYTRTLPPRPHIIYSAVRYSNHLINSNSMHQRRTRLLSITFHKQPDPFPAPNRVP